jgi:hypothetical protein
MEKRLDGRLDSARALMIGILAAVTAGIVLQLFFK